MLLLRNQYNESYLDMESLYNPCAGYFLLGKYHHHKREVGCHRPEF